MLESVSDLAAGGSVSALISDWSPIASRSSRPLSSATTGRGAIAFPGRKS